MNKLKKGAWYVSSISTVMTWTNHADIRRVVCPKFAFDFVLVTVPFQIMLAYIYIYIHMGLNYLKMNRYQNEIEGVNKSYNSAFLRNTIRFNATIPTSLSKIISSNQYFDRFAYQYSKYLNF